MALEGWKVQRCARKDISAFIEKWHYSASINGCIADYCYELLDAGGVQKGAMFFGRMAMAGQWKKFGESETGVIELRRLCCADDTPKNAESFFIGRSLKLLKKDWGGSIVVSYADAEHGHSGVIYRASNFEYRGFAKGARVIDFGGRTYHDKAVRTKYKGQPKPFAARLAAALAEGTAVYRETKGKHTYVYTIRGNRK